MAPVTSSFECRRSKGIKEIIYQLAVLLLGAILGSDSVPLGCSSTATVLEAASEPAY